MKRLVKILLFVSGAISLAACGGASNNAPVANSNANSNANTAKPVAAAPTADTFLDMEKKANEAYSKGDGAYFDGMLSDKAVMSMNKDRMGKADIVSMIKTAKCEGVETKLSEPQLLKINDDTYAFTYKNESTGKCNDEKGKMVDMKPMRASTVWIRNGDKWQAAWHGENLIMGAPAADKKDEKAADAKKTDTKPAPPAAKKDEPKKDDAKPAGPPPPPAKLTPSPNTDALTKTHAAGWEAFRTKDAKFFDGALTTNFGFVTADGNYVASKADAIKTWTETMKCEGITKTSFTEGFAQSLSPTTELLFGKGNADGKCDGQPNGDLWTTAVYAKEGDAWKLAYMFESLPQK